MRITTLDQWPEGLVPEVLKAPRHRRTKRQMQTLRDQLFAIIEKDQPVGVRQVFYRMAVPGYVPKTEASYRVVGRLLVQMRKDGIIPFSWISDNTRWIRKPATYSSAEEALLNVKTTYRQDLWRDQPVYVEVWCEKDALAGVIKQETYPYQVPLMVSRGFSSLSYIYTVAEEIKRLNKPAYIYYFGDHDPSGLKIERAIRKNLREFASDVEIHFQRVSVLPEQIKTLNLPTRPTKKMKNPHAKGFKGPSVDLDAIPATTLRAMVRKCIERHIDQHALSVTRAAEASERELFTKLVKGLHKKQ
jgi:hypothetical protein